MKVDPFQIIRLSQARSPRLEQMKEGPESHILWGALPYASNRRQQPLRPIEAKNGGHLTGCRGLGQELGFL